MKSSLLILSDRTFKVSLFISACIHLALLYPWSLWLRSGRPEISFNKIELTYYKEGPIKAIVIKEIRPITSLSRKEKSAPLELTKKETITVEAEKILVADKEKVAAKKASSLTSQKEIMDTMQKDGADTEYEDALTQYCLTVRKKIRDNLEKNGKGFSSRGDVYVRIVINRDGSMRNIVLYKSSARNIQHLERIAMRSIRESFPFPAFDKRINMAELALKIPIRFTP